MGRDFYKEYNFLLVFFLLSAIYVEYNQARTEVSGNLNARRVECIFITIRLNIRFSLDELLVTCPMTS